MELGLKGKSVLITGASKGIGLACAQAFAAEGCALHLASRDPARLEAAKAEILAQHKADIGLGFYEGLHAITFSLRPTLVKAATALSISSALWAADIWVRMRALPCGTTG